MKKAIVVLAVLSILILTALILIFANPAVTNSIVAIVPNLFNTSAIVIVAIVALILLFLSKSSYNVFGSGKVNHIVHVEHKYYGNDDDNGDIQWVNRGENE